MAQEIHAELGLTAMEIMNDVFQAPYARQFDQAENRLNTIKTVIAATLGRLFLPESK